MMYALAATPAFGRKALIHIVHSCTALPSKHASSTDEADHQIGAHRARRRSICGELRTFFRDRYLPSGNVGVEALLQYAHMRWQAVGCDTFVAHRWTATDAPVKTVTAGVSKLLIKNN